MWQAATGGYQRATEAGGSGGCGDAVMQWQRRMRRRTFMPRYELGSGIHPSTTIYLYRTLYMT